MKAKKRRNKIEARYVRPTEERERHNHTRAAGAARRIVPMIEILHNRGDLDEDQYRALAYYRDQASIADKSPVRSCCDDTPRGGYGPGVSIMSAILETGRIERDLGTLRDITRAIAVDDWSLSRWCIEKHGGRERYDSKGKLIAIVPVNEKQVVHTARLELRYAAGMITP